MFVSAIKKAHDAAEGLAIEAAFGIAAVLLGCVALIFAAAGAALWLSTLIPLHFALLTVSVSVTLIAAIVFSIGQREFNTSRKLQESNTEPSSPITSLLNSFGSMGAPMDLVASGLFARQVKKAPIATIAATAAVGVLASMLANADENETPS